MPRRSARRRKAPARPVDWDTAGHRARVRHLYDLAGENEDARRVAWFYSRWPEDNTNARDEIAYLFSDKHARFMKELRQVQEAREREAALRREEIAAAALPLPGAR